MSPKTAARHFSSAGPHAIASLKVETSAVLKELARFRACDDQTMSCFYCREWAQWVYRKQISPQAAAAAAASASGTSAGSAGRKKKSKAAGAPPPASGAVQQAAATAEDAVTSAAERKRAVRQRYSTVADLCESLRGMVADERRLLAADDGGDVTGGTSGSRPGSPAPAPAISDERAEALGSSTLINDITERVTLWYEGHQFPLADVYEDLTFDFPADAFPYDDHQDPLDPALLLPALQVTKAFVGLPAADFALLGNITSELIATHTYPTCQHTKADHPTPAELETQRLIFNAQLGKWRGDYRRSFECEMEPVWQITHLLLKSAQRIDAMRVRLFARGCRANRAQFLQTIRTRTLPFAEYWPAAAAALPSPPQPAAVDALVAEHLDNLLEVSATWSRTFLESYYGVAREFARELETILGECITMCDRRAQGLKYPPPLTLQPQLDAARAAIGCLLPRLDARIQRIQRVVVERNAEIRAGTDDVRRLWAETSGATAPAKLARAGQKDLRKRIKRIEYQQQTGVIGWAMRELELLLTAPDVAAVIADCLELLMTEAEILERAVAQVFVRKLEPNADDLREQRQDIIDDFTEGLLTGREELAGVIGKLMLKEAWRILEANISLQRQKALLDGSGAGSSSKSKKKQQQQQLDPPLTLPSAPLTAAAGDDQYSVADDDDLHDDDADASKKRKKNKKKKNKKAKGKSAAAAKTLPPAAPGHPSTSADVASAAEDDDEDEDDEATCVYADANDSQRDPQNPFDSLAWMSPSESSAAAAAAAQQPKQAPVATDAAAAAAAARNGTEPAKKAAVATVAQPALQIQTQVQARAPPPPPPQSNDGEAVKAARSRRGTNAARYVPGVGFVSDDGVSATSPQLVASATSTAVGALRAVPPGGRMSPMSTVRMASPAPRSQSPLVMSGGPTSAILPAGGDRRTLDKDALAKLQASLSLGPAENIERTLSGLTHDSLVALASTAIIERRRTMDSAVEWNKAVDKVLSTYDMIAGQIVSLKTLCESHDSETERLGTLLAQSAQEARKWQEQCVRLSAEVEALKAQNTGEKELQPNGNLWSVGDQQQQQHVESNPWAGSGYYGQTYPASNNAFGHFVPGLVPPPGHQAQPPAGYMANASSYAAAVAAIQAQAMAQQQMPSQHGQQQQQSMPLSGSTDTSASSLLTALNTRSQAF
ncbi:hypothetical protein GGI14_004649 [Coemansia sp. S680]|nr:hypothetical protein GGI14_004649 [Coemansia sp. S680]